MPSQQSSRPDGLTRVLGGTSFALGLSELIAPGAVAAVAGVAPTSRTRGVIRALGLRECGHGAAVLFGSPRLVWTRVAGDVLDVALLIAGLSAPGARRGRGVAAGLVLAGIGALDVYATLRTHDDHEAKHGAEIEPRHRGEEVRPQHGGAAHLAQDRGLPSDPDPQQHPL
jgi:hypothetical protein